MLESTSSWSSKWATLDMSLESRHELWGWKINQERVASRIKSKGLEQLLWLEGPRGPYTHWELWDHTAVINVLLSSLLRKLQCHWLCYFYMKSGTVSWIGSICWWLPQMRIRPIVFIKRPLVFHQFTANFPREKQPENRTSKLHLPGSVWH